MVHQVGHVIAPHPRILRGLDNGAGHFLFLWLVGHVGLDRNVADDRLIARADRGRYRHCTDTSNGLADPRLEAGLALLDLLMAFHLQINALGYPAEGLVLLGQSPDFHALLAQAIQIGLQLAQQATGRGRAAVMRFLPLIAQAHGFADGVLQHLGVVALLLQFFDTAFDRAEGGAHRRTDGAADHQP